MKYKKTITILVLLISILSIICCLLGIFSDQIKDYPNIMTVRNEVVELYNKGLYARDSFSMATQAIAQDCVTLIMGIPLLLVSLHMMRKGNTKGTFLLTGTIGYFLYTYTSYSFLMMYNCFYLVYLILMTLSLYAFILCMLSFDSSKLKSYFSDNFPRKSVSIILGLMSFMLCFMWLGRIVPTIFSDAAPHGLEHYSTLGIQTLDLGVIVPAGFITAFLTWKRYPYGYILSTVLTLKLITMGSAVSAMAVSMYLNNIEIDIVELFVFPIFTLLIIIFMFVILKSVKNESLLKMK